MTASHSAKLAEFIVNKGYRLMRYCIELGIYKLTK